LIAPHKPLPKKATRPRSLGCSTISNGTWGTKTNVLTRESGDFYIFIQTIPNGPSGKGPEGSERILVIEDNPKIGGLLRRVLEEQGYYVDIATDGFEGEERAVVGRYDIILLDFMLPQRNGLEICQDLRRSKIGTLILMLTSLSDTRNKIAALGAGADDYLTKPFDVAELIARVRALLRRAHPESNILRYEDLELDLNQRSASRSGKQLSLSAKEFDLLEHLMRNPDRVASRSLLCERIWNLRLEEKSTVIEVYISRLRNKIDRGFDKPLLHTITGRGYILSAHSNRT
jgi:DNA-binding response OmpR family regulator